MATEIKICGLSDEEAIKAAISAGAQHIGFIFFEKSPRNISIDKAAELAEKFRREISLIAVTVNAPDTFLKELIERVHPHQLQLHGSETPERVKELKEKFSQPVIKAFAIREAGDFKKLSAYRGIADRFLLDAKAPEGSDLPGGNGVSFDWNLLKALRSDRDYMLSGGLDAGNIVEALEISGAKAIDVSSGVEAAPGVKDVAKIDTFIKTIKDYDATGATSAA